MGVIPSLFSPWNISFAIILKDRGMYVCQSHPKKLFRPWTAPSSLRKEGLPTNMAMAVSAHSLSASSAAKSVLEILREKAPCVYPGKESTSLTISHAPGSGVAGADRISWPASRLNKCRQGIQEGRRIIMMGNRGKERELGLICTGTEVRCLMYFDKVL